MPDQSQQHQPQEQEKKQNASVEDLPSKAMSPQQTESIKGGRALSGGDDSPTERR